MGSDGLPLELELDGRLGASFPYQLPPDGVFQGTLTSTGETRAGYAVVTVDEGTQLPVGTAIFQFRDAQGRLISEAGVWASSRQPELESSLIQPTPKPESPLPTPGTPANR